MDSSKIETAQLTDVGQEREINEDSVLTVSTPKDLQERLGIETVLVVADGVGGHHAGEVASAMAVKTVESLFSGDGLTSLNDGEEAVRYVIRTANREIFNYTDAVGRARPATTMTVAALSSEAYVVGHVGDSRAYRLNQTGIWQITKDDTVVADAVRAGEMTEEQARNSPMRNQITKSVGVDLLLSPSVVRGGWNPGDLIFLCSDGLSEYVEPAEIFEILSGASDLETGCRKLVDTANSRGGHDNITVAVARNASSGIRRSASTWPPAGESKAKIQNIPRVSKPGVSNRGPWAVISVALIAFVTVAGVYVKHRLVRAKPVPPTLSVETSPPPPPKKTVVEEQACGLDFDVEHQVLAVSASPKYEVDAAGSPDDHRFDKHGKEVWVTVRDVDKTKEMLSADYRFGFADGNNVLIKSDTSGKIPLKVLPEKVLTLVLLEDKTIKSRMLDFTLKPQKQKNNPLRGRSQ